MSRRRFATRLAVEQTVSLQALLDRTPGARAPMDVAVLLAHEVLRAVAEVHAQGRTCGALDASSFEVSADGAVALRGVGDGSDVLADVASVGGVLYQLFTGVSASQARARLAVPRLDQVPAPSRLNPALDDALSDLVVAMLAGDPSERPYSLAHVLATVLDVMDDLGLAPQPEAIARWAGLAAAPAPAPVAPAPAVKLVPVVARSPARRAPPRSWQTDDDEAWDEDDDAPVGFVEPVRFDGWALLACCFAVASLAIAFSF